MIGCDAPDCQIEWFHFSCVGVTEEPQTDEKWFCNECKEQLNMYALILLYKYSNNFIHILLARKNSCG